MAESEKAVQVGKIWRVTLNGTVAKYDALAYDGTNYVVADADWTASNPLYARCFALAAGISGDVIDVTNELVITDADAPYTVGATYYLSTTAGGKTTTRPTAADDLVQVLGAAKTTSVLHLCINPPREAVHVYNPSGGTDAPTGRLDTGDFGGWSANASADNIFFNVVWPANAVSLATSELYVAAESTVSTPTFDMFTSMAKDGDQWDAGTQDTGIADSAFEGAAADEIQMTVVTAGMNITSQGPRAILGIRINKDDTGTDQSFVFALATAWVEV